MICLVLNIENKISAKGNNYKLITYKELNTTYTKTAFYYGTLDIQNNVVYNITIETKPYGDVLSKFTTSDTPISAFMQTYCTLDEFRYYVNNIKQWIEELSEPYKSIVKEFYTKYGLYDEYPENNPYLTNTAAIRYHHVNKYGLIAHIFEVTCNAINLFNIYAKTNPNPNIVVAGALLHDLGKFETYQISEVGIPEISEKGEYINHLPYGMALLMTSSYREQYPTEITRLLEIIQSHHTKIEYGAVDTPKTIESIIVAQADIISYYTEAYIQGVKDINQKTIPIGEFKIINPNYGLQEACSIDTNFGGNNAV